VARGGGAIEILDTQQGSTLCTLAPPEGSSRPGSNSNGGPAGPASISGLAFRHASSEEPQLDLVSCSSTGLLRLHRLAAHTGAESAPQTADQLWGRWSLGSSIQTAPNVGCMVGAEGAGLP
jgi:hypothetical protein